MRQILQKVRRVGAISPRGKIFQMAGVVAEKALLDPTNQNFLTDGIRNMPLCLCGWGRQSHHGETVPRIMWTHVMQDFKGNN